jgi:hypothetical protein
MNWDHMYDSMPAEDAEVTVVGGTGLMRPLSQVRISSQYENSKSGTRGGPGEERCDTEYNV